MYEAEAQPPIRLYVVPSIEEADTLQAIGLEAAAFHDRKILMQRIEDAAPHEGDAVCAIGEARGIIGDLKVMKLAVLSAEMPVGHGSATAFVMSMRGRNMQDADIAREFATRIAHATSSTWNDDRPPTEHPDAPRRRSKVEAAWRSPTFAEMSTEPAPRRWLVRSPERDGVPVDDLGDGLVPAGIAAGLMAEGGVGKTTVLLELCVAIITGRRWLGHYAIDNAMVGRRCLAVLAEETHDEILRKLHSIRQRWKLSDDEIALIAERLVTVPLYGQGRAPLLEQVGEHGVRPTSHMKDIRRLVAESADDWGLIAFDPLARCAGVNLDVDNTRATNVLEEFEHFTNAPGKPTVILSHHSSKAARESGSVNARGPSGITDAMRWVCTLQKDATGTDVLFRQSKSNYSRPWAPNEHLRLIRVPGGALRVATDAELASRQDSIEAAEDSRIVEAAKRAVSLVEAARQPFASKDELARRLKGRLQNGRQAIDHALHEGWLTFAGPTYRGRVFALGPVVCAETPIPPGRSGRSRPPGGGTDLPSASHGRPGRPSQNTVDATQPSIHAGFSDPVDVPLVAENAWTSRDSGRPSVDVPKPVDVPDVRDDHETRPGNPDDGLPETPGGRRPRRSVATWEPPAHREALVQPQPPSPGSHRIPNLRAVASVLETPWHYTPAELSWMVLAPGLPDLDELKKDLWNVGYRVEKQWTKLPAAARDAWLALFCSTDAALFGWMNKNYGGPLKTALRERFTSLTGRKLNSKELTA